MVKALFGVLFPFNEIFFENILKNVCKFQNYVYLCKVIKNKKDMKTLSTIEKLNVKYKGLNNFYASLETAIANGDTQNEERYFNLIAEISEEINALEVELIKNK